MSFNSNKLPRVWLIIPAAGFGQRMQSCTPKQYLKIAGQTILEHTLSVFEDIPVFDQVILVLSKEDAYWKKLKVKSSLNITVVDGGEERYDSVLNGLIYLQEFASNDDWVFVHDAARPGLKKKDVDNLLNKLSNHPVGGLLGIPVKDTLKWVNAASEAERTIDRAQLWHALTPQVFRYDVLFAALDKAKSYAHKITDEASAVELNNLKPFMVEGSADNIKVTNPDDLALMELILKRRKLQL